MVEAVLIYLAGVGTGIVITLLFFKCLNKSYEMGQKDAHEGRNIADE